MTIQKDILFIRLRLLGDIVMTIPAVQIYKSLFPDNRIFYVVEEKFKEIAALIPGIHQLIVIPRKMSIRQMWAFRKEMHKRAFDTVIDFHSGPKSAQLTFLSGAKKRIGYRTPNRNWAYTHLTPRTFGKAPTHSVFNQAKLLEHLNISISEFSLPHYPAITPDPSVISPSVKDLISKNKSKRKIVVHVGAGNAFREWGTDKFSGLFEKLTADDCALFLIGHGAAEQDKGAYFAERYGLADLTGQLSIAELYYLIAASDVYMGADSGPLHLASLTETPIVALYGPNLPAISGPWRKKRVTILEKEMDCRPCDQRTCIYGIIPCMKTITTDEVYEAISRYYQ